MPRNSPHYCLPRIPFQYRGGKAPVADKIWQRLGDPPVYVDGFGGRSDTLFSRPPTRHRQPVEIVGDLYGMISNFFRTARHAPDELSERIDSDARSEHDLIARANWVKINRERIDKLVKESPTAYDLDAAHYWLYQMCGQLDTQAVESLREKMILSFSLDLLELDDTRGYFRTMSHRLRGVDILCEDWEATVNIATGQHLNIPTGRCLDLMRERLRKVRLPRRDWEATVGSARREGNITYGVLLDPPYPYEAGRKGKMYVRDDAGAVSDAAFQWACWHGDDPQFRIAFCGFAGSYKWPDGWTEVPWSSPKCSPGNEGRERIWFSPHCLNVEPNQGAA